MLHFSMQRSPLKLNAKLQNQQLVIKVRTPIQLAIHFLKIHLSHFKECSQRITVKPQERKELGRLVTTTSEEG
jgi:hypothetical protein